MASIAEQTDGRVQSAALRDGEAARRAKPLQRVHESSQQVRAVRAACGGQAFAAAIAAAGSNNNAVARAWGCDERVVREVIAGISPLTFERIRSSPRDVRRALITAEAQALDEEMAPTSAACPVRATLHVAGTVGELAAAAEEASRDGVYTLAEIEDIERKAMRAETASRTVRLVARAVRVTVKTETR